MRYGYLITKLVKKVSLTQLLYLQVIPYEVNSIGSYIILPHKSFSALEASS